MRPLSADPIGAFTNNGETHENRDLRAYRRIRLHARGRDPLCPGPAAEAGWDPPVRDQRGDPALRLPRQRYLRDAAFRGAVLFDAAALQPVEISRGRG